MALLSAEQTLTMILALEGEVITYLEPGREPKTITAMVEREPPEIKEFRSTGSPAGGTTAARTVFQITIANQEPDGMTTIRKGQDKVQFKRQLGDDEETTFVVSSILKHDQGAWMLEVTA